MRDYINFQIHLTDDCNMQCLHCYHDDTKVNYLKAEKFDYILQEVLRYTKAQGKVPGRAIFCGGEPTLSPILLESIRKCRDAGYTRVSVLTNGTLITEQFAKKLVNAGCTIVQICIEGNKETHNYIRNGTFDQVIATWEICRRNGLEVKNQTTLNSLNYQQIDEIMEICKGKVDFNSFLRQVPHNKELGMLTANQWLEILKKFYLKYLKEGESFLDFNHIRDLQWLSFFLGGLYTCNFKWDYFLSALVEANGDVYACRKSNIVVGNIFKNTLEEIHRDSPILRRARERENLNQTCSNCSRVNVCGGCMGIANAAYGDYFAEDPQCFRELIDEAFWEEIIAGLRAEGKQKDEIDTAQIIDFMKLTGSFADTYAEAQVNKALYLNAMEAGIKNSLKEQKNAEDLYRMANGLYSVKEAAMWLKEKQISPSTFSRFIHNLLLASKFIDKEVNQNVNYFKAQPEINNLTSELIYQDWLEQHLESLDE